VVKANLLLYFKVRAFITITMICFLVFLSMFYDMVK